MLLAVGGERHAVVGIIPSEMTKSCPGHFAPEEDAQEVVEEYWDEASGTGEISTVIPHFLDFHRRRFFFVVVEEKSRTLVACPRAVFTLRKALNYFWSTVESSRRKEVIFAYSFIGT